ncbi:hypothetical protein HRbin21_01124 [bacterium HR21]|nr:hypothetical protein HRbin21_01124 [bacterium HR21]
MAPRNTGTGWVFEQMVVPALERGGYSYQKQYRAGIKPDGRPYIADLLVTDLRVNPNRKLLVSLKWQQTSGTAEQKVPYEVITLLALLDTSNYHGAYLVLGGGGWSPELKKFYTGGGLATYIPGASRIRILDLYDFIALANNRQL